MRIALLLALFAALLFPAAHAADTYHIDSGDSSIRFSVRHMVIHKVHGRFKEFSGTLLLDESDLTKSSVEVTIQTASINTEDGPRDKDLRSASFLEVEKYPKMSFASRRVEKNAEGYALVGDLSLHGVTKEVRIPFTFNGKVKNTMGKTVAGFDGRVTINRQEWGINYSKLLDNGGLVAGNEVEIELDVVAVKEELSGQ
ncbi:MAG: YceI family protein [Candidatus Korobacteraceae bacterium]